jgi:hypothetical protein
VAIALAWVCPYGWLYPTVGMSIWAHVGPRARALRCLSQTSKKRVSWKKRYVLYVKMFSFSRVRHFSCNFANMVSPAEMTITTRTASKFCAKIRAVQPPIFYPDLISRVITGIAEQFYVGCSESSDPVRVRDTDNAYGACPPCKSRLL